MIAIFLLKKDTSIFHYGIISCGHLDMSMGLYKSLLSTMNDSGSHNLDVLPLGSGLTDSEIAIVSKYTQNQVSNAPQEILVGPNGWCLVSYFSAYTFDGVQSPHRENETTICHNYNGIGQFNFEGLLLRNNLEIILAYSSFDPQPSLHRANEQNKRFHVMHIVSVLQLITQLAVLISTLLVYGNRSGAKDLSRVSPLFLHIITLISMVAGISMVVAAGVVTSQVNALKNDIHKSVGAFGILMRRGRVFFSLLWLAFGFAMLGMLSWIVPHWLANPPKTEYYDDENENETLQTTEMGSDISFLGGARTASRNPKAELRIFDLAHDDVASASSLTNENPMSNELNEHQAAASELDLRKLSERLFRKKASRQLTRELRSESMPVRSDTRELLYREVSFSNHQYPTALPRPRQPLNLSQSRSTMREVLGGSLLRMRILLDKDRNSATSVLDEQEMEILLDKPYIYCLDE